MKKIGLLVAVVILLCSLGTQPAAAQEPGFGFVPLLSEGYDASLLREVSSRASYERLLPRLMEAKVAGLLTGFEPDFYGGYVKIIEPSTQLRDDSGFLPIFTSREDAVVRPPLQAAKIGDKTASFDLNFYLYSSYVSFNIGIPDAHIKGTLRSPSGEVLGVINDYADSSGNYWNYWQGYNDTVLPGQKITIKILNASEVLVGTYTMTVPRINFSSLSKSTGLVTGTGAAGKPFMASLWHENLNAANDGYSEQISGTISSSGNWSADFSRSMRGGDSVNLRVDMNSNFSFYRSVYAPRVGCMLWSNSCWTENLPNKAVVLSVIHGGTTYNFSGKTDPSGVFRGYLYNTNGDPVQVSAGDKVSGTGAVTEIIPNLTLTANRAADTVSGTAPANKWFGVAIYIWEPYDSDYDWVKSGATGAFTANYSIDIPAEGTIEPDIWYTNPSTGNYWYYYKMIP